MRKLSFLTVAVVASFLTIAASASAADRYAFPSGDATNVATCGPSDNCDLVSAMDTTYVADNAKVRVAPGTYSVSTALSLTASGAGIYGQGTTAADVVINSTITGSPALTISNDSEGEKFTLNSATLGSNSGGLNVVNGNVSHVKVVATGPDMSYANACTGVDARFVNTLCRSTSTFGSAFRSAQSMTLQFSFINSTLIPGPYGYGFAGTTLNIGNEMNVEMFSTIIVSGSGHPIMLGRPTGAPAPAFNAEYSNFECTQVVFDQISGQSCLPPENASNQTDAPIFKDADNGDYTPAAGSPTVDAGSITGLSGSKDLAGNARIQGAAIDIGAYESAPVVVPPPATGGGTIIPPVIDTTNPTITVSKKPKSKTTSTKLKVVFKASETATFQCKLDKGKFKTCKSPYKKTVKLGKHKLQIKATDAAGNVSAIKSVSWKVTKP
jgi:hypothetical protein